MKNYNFKEETKFEGLIPNINSKLNVIGNSNKSVHLYCQCVKGAESLETIDIESIWDNQKQEETEITEPNFNDSEIILTSNYNPDETIVIEEGEKTIELNGNQLTAPTFVDESDNSSNSYGLWVKGGKVIINGQGEIIAQDADYSMAVWANGGTVVINDGVFRNGGENCDLIYVSNGGTVEIYGGEFYATHRGEGNGTKNEYSALNIKDRDRENSKITVYGGKFFKFNPGDNVSEGEHTNFVAEGYKSIQDGDYWIVIPE